MSYSISGFEFGFEIERKGATAPLYRQVHGAEIVELRNHDQRGEFLESPHAADGATTEAIDLELYVFTADCLPLLFFGEDGRRPLATVHAGWKGTKDGVVGNAVRSLLPRAKALNVVLGPAILSCCFEVRQDLIDAFEGNGHSLDGCLKRREGRIFFDLPKFLIQTELRQIDLKRIHTQFLRCTVCSSPQLPSYRRNRGTDPTLRSWIIKHS